ncbi:MAG: hypothetical protein ABI407_11490 [Bradyrhizobium sp.]
MVTKPTDPDPLVPMLVHALFLVGDDPVKRAQVTQFFKEMGPVLRKAYDDSFDDESWSGTSHA